MGFWDDLGAVTEEFTDKYTTARRFRIQRQSEQQRQALQRQEIAIREEELRSRLAKQQEEKQIRDQIRVLANEYNRILSTPTPGVWDFPNHTITDKAAAELIKISAQIAALDPQTGATYGRYVDMIYQQPKPEQVKPSELEQKISVIESKIGRTLKEPEVLALAGVTSKTGESGGKKTPTIDELGAAATLSGVPLVAIPAGQRIAAGVAAQHPRMNIVDQAALTGGPSVAAVKEPIINEPEDTVAVDINDPRLMDTTATDTPFGIDVNAPATEDNEPIDENDVLDKLEELKRGRKPFNSYKAGRQYFLKAKQKGLIDQSFYDVTHNKYLSPAYPDTAR